MAGWPGLGCGAAWPGWPALWARGTAGYAAAQAGSAFLLAGVFAASGEMHAAIFALGLLASAAALAAVMR